MDSIIASLSEKSAFNRGLWNPEIGVYALLLRLINDPFFYYDDLILLYLGMNNLKFYFVY